MLRTLLAPSRLATILLLALVFALPAFAQPAGSNQQQPAAQSETRWPVAVRWWGQGLVTIETWWGLTVAIDPYATGIGYGDPDLTADLVLITHAHDDHNNAELVKGDPAVFRGLDENGEVRELRVAVDRRPNEDEPRAGELEQVGDLSEHAITAFTVPSFHDDQEGAERGENALWVVEADGVRILHMGDFGQKQLSTEQLAKIGNIDVVLIPVGGVYTVDGRGATAIVEQVKPRMVVPIHYKTEALKIELQPADAFIEALPERYTRRQASGNTLAVSRFLPPPHGAQNGGPHETPVSVVKLDYRPWEMPPELAALFEKKEAAQERSAAVFAPLSAKQMNFRPSNGTHTPRWNVEHMNGTELAMLSAFYASADRDLGRIRERPEQMPPDYVPAQPEWTGKEEARQIERTQAFSRRFAYLLDGKGIDAQVEGVPWPLGRVLEAMEQHYTEHTANVEKKFDLPDWPGE